MLRVILLKLMFYLCLMLDYFKVHQQLVSGVVVIFFKCSENQRINWFKSVHDFFFVSLFPSHTYLCTSTLVQHVSSYFFLPLHAELKVTFLDTIGYVTAQSDEGFSYLNTKVATPLSSPIRNLTRYSSSSKQTPLCTDRNMLPYLSK